MFLNNMEWDNNCEQASNIIIEAANRYQTPSNLMPTVYAEEFKNTVMEKIPLSTY